MIFTASFLFDIINNNNVMLMMPYDPAYNFITYIKLSSIYGTNYNFIIKFNP